MVLRDHDNLLELVVMESKVVSYLQHTLADLVLDILDLVRMGE